MFNYTTCAYDYRNGLKVFLIPWGHTNEEFNVFYKVWKTKHFLNFKDPATFDFLPDPAWKDC
jgi:hypothetical protein